VRCPFCSFEATRVVDSRLTEPGDAVRRRRECAGCGNRFTTYERGEGIALQVEKRDGRREHFDRQKLLGGLLRAATKRPVTVPELEAVADSIEAYVRRAGGEAEAEGIGELALRGLIELDRVAAIRFASVYRNFEDLTQFEAELRRLESEPIPTADQLALEGSREAPGPSGAEGSIGLSPTGPAPGGKGESPTARREHAPQP